MTRIKLILLLCFFVRVAVSAQVKIGNNPNTINGASLLELETTNKGFVFPRVALTSLNSSLPLPAGLLTGTVVFNTATGIGSGIGLYYWSGSAWVAVSSGGSVSAWTTTGNSGTNTSNFLGTTDNISMRFRTNNVLRMILDSIGNVKAKLDTGGSFLILNHETPGLVKLQIRETGEVNWYLDGQDLFIRDGFFDAFGDGKLYKYDFMHIDGTTGRIGFNILDGYSDGSSGGENNLPLTSSVTLLGSIATKVRLLDGSSNYAIQQDDHIMIIDKTDNSNTDMILSPVDSSQGREYIFKRNNNSDGAIIVKPAPGEKLNGIVDGDVTLGQDNSTLEVVCGPDSWWVISEISATTLAQITTTFTAYTPNKDDKTILADASSGSFTVTLPGAATVEAGQTYTLKRTNAGTNTVIVAGNGSETIDGIPSLRLNQRFDYLQLESDGTNWIIISERISPSLVVNPALPYAATVYDGIIASNGAGTINLPSTAAVLGGKIFTIKNSARAGNRTLTVVPNGSETVDGLATWPILQGQFVTIQSDGTNWIIIGQ